MIRNRELEKFAFSGSENICAVNDSDSFRQLASTRRHTYFQCLDGAFPQIRPQKPKSLYLSYAANAPSQIPHAVCIYGTERL